MPELPEVETVKNELAPLVIGRQISGVTLNWEGMVGQPSPKEFERGVKDKRILNLYRRGKYLLLELNGGWLLVIHLRMTGSLEVGDDLAKTPLYTRAIIHLEGGRHIYFRDPRKFGKMKLVKDAASIIGKLGPEPLEDNFTPAVLKERLAGRKAPLKAVLLEQNVIAGIGNMYADEALFAARIHPLKEAEALSADELKRLHQSIRQVLKKGIELKGASVSNYLRPGGQKGGAQREFNVAHRKNEDCPHCGNPLDYIKIRGRGSHFCPCCQPLK
ncbi:MAG: DNA-formamidopyrimidine glycosylase [Chloroflexi bacterium]|nr:DNA-formamidopyrimidine glycosylase [Chloroflexota bacterium]